MKPSFSLLHLEGVPILEQLQIEEALLRADEGNWCLINSNVKPAIVMGISGKVERLLNTTLVKKDNIPVIKRFSGGGTVYVDEKTLFVTFICNSKTLDVTPFPQAIMQWSERFYKPLFPNFSLRENDYVFGEHKFGGNAQYIKKDRWLHHTSFLWDFDPEKMNYLKLPEKRPQYRQDRPHSAFLTTLKPHYPSKENLIEKLKEILSEKFDLTEKKPEGILSRPHRKSTVYVDVVLEK